MTAGKATTGQDFALVAAGDGARRWALCPDGPVGLPREKVQAVRQFSIDPAEPRASARRVLQALDQDLDSGRAVAGYWSYELGAALERQPRPNRGPDAAWITFDRRDLQPVEVPKVAVPGAQLPAPQDLLRQQGRFLAGAATVAEAIAGGQVYQVNLTCEFGVAMPAPRLQQAVAAVLAAQPVPYALGLQLGDLTVISGSMERFLAVDGAGVRSRPIKGTAPRGHDPASDAAQRQWLAGQEKERAENTMIVDMVRSDLQRVCQVGSVAVPELLVCEPYATLWHLESEVSGQLREVGNFTQLLAATLPPASVTGCPKIRAMQVIDDLEQRSRGVYCGTLGMLWPEDRGP
ncbi:MAG: chorismate-binding protein, partial [Deltaproteobacteria bacterium]|nr:chorismate-binding protein [Deltaproteobacteria bacterium]